MHLMGVRVEGVHTFLNFMVRADTRIAASLVMLKGAYGNGISSWLNRALKRSSELAVKV